MTQWRAVVALLCAVLLALTVLAVNPLIRAAEGYSKSTVASSIAVYASLRAINAFLSTAQEVEVGASFVASGTAQPLKVLEPLDDTVERVASVVLTLTMVSGVMIVGFAPVAGIGYALVILGWVGGLFSPLHAAGRAALRWGLVLGLVVPLAFIAAGVLGDLVTAGALAQHELLLASLAQDISPVAEGAAQAARPTATATGAGTVTDWLLSQLSGVVDTTAAVTNATTQTLARLEDYRDAAQLLVGRSDDLLASYIAIIAAYVLKGVVLPAVLVGLALALSRRASAS